MSEYKLIASDLDGTLLDGVARVSEGNLIAIKKITGMGGIFVPSTGRALAEIPKELLDLPEVRYIIYANGATVIDRATGERIEACIEGEKLTAVLKVLSRYDTHIAVRYKGATYIDKNKNTKEDYTAYDLCAEHVRVISIYGVELGNFNEWINSIASAEVVTVFLPDGESTERARAELLAIGGIATASVAYNNLEVMNEGAGKGNALLALTKKLGVPRSRVIAVGDSGNDLTSMRVSGLALAVSNATDAVKAEADAVICSNEEDIADYILKNYF